MADDRELWKRICGGDLRAFEAFYRDNAPRLQNFLRQLLPAPQAAEDVTHETFLQMWRRPNGFRPERGSLRIQHPQVSKDHAETNSLVSDVFERLNVEQKSLLWLR